MAADFAALVARHCKRGFRAHANARGVLYHSAKLDSRLCYPPYGKHKKLRGLLERLMS